MKRSLFRLWLLTGLSMFFLASVCAQGPGDPMPAFPFSNFRFNFINPGGRATAMGQAFIALGDDATGSETNPAGLTALLTPQLFIEGRLISNRFQTLAPTDEEIRYAASSDHTFSPTFLSLVYPFRNWAFGFYRQELADYAISFHQPGATIPGVYNILTPTPSPVVALPFDSTIDLALTNYGVSVAHRWGERLNLGVSIRASRLSFETVERQPPEVIAPLFRLPEGDTAAVQFRIQDEDWDISWVAGLIIKPLDWLRIGGVYRSGSRHEVRAVFKENILDLHYQPLRVDIPDFEVKVPDRYGFGLGFTPTDDLTLTFDVVRIEYGDLTPQFIDYLQAEFQDDYEFSNGWEFHLGGEYAIYIKDVPVFLRGGFYSDPDNSIHFVGDRAGNDVFTLPPNVVLPVDEVFSDYPRVQSAYYPRNDTDFHGTFGVGMIFRNHFLLDLAADLSRETDYWAISFLYNF
jgi:long-subunit fatty acid transport protein